MGSDSRAPLSGSLAFFFSCCAVLWSGSATCCWCSSWAISTNFLPDKRTSYLVIALLFLLYVALFIWQQEILDPASVLYVYETPPGWTIVAIRCLLVLWACWCLVHTYQLETEFRKKQFYLVWSVIALTWLGSLPVIVGIAHELPSWVRRRIVFGLVNSVQAALYIALTYLFRPFRSNRYVDILKPDESRAFGQTNDDRRSWHGSEGQGWGCCCLLTVHKRS